MKKIYGFLGACALLMLAACNSDEPLVNNGTYGGDDGRVAYINATIALPSNGGRSATDTIGDSNSNGSSNSGNGLTDSENPTEGSDVEVGKPSENTVRSMVLVIADKQDRYLTHLVVTGMSAGNQLGGKYVFETKARIPYSTLTEAYGPGGLFSQIASGTKPMHLYAFCNFTNNMLTQFNDYQNRVKATAPGERTDSLLHEWRDFKGNVYEKASMAGQSPQSQASIWSDNSFMMANSKVYDSKFPEKIEDWDDFADENHPLSLTEGEYGTGPIDVERLAARIDFRDASPEGDQVYPILYDNSKWNLYSVRLSRMVLVNMSNNFYYLRRVSNNGQNENASYAGTEGLSNFVVDSDAKTKSQTTDGYPTSPGINVKNASNYFNFPLFDETTTSDQVLYNNMYGTYGWYITDISEILNNGNTDNWKDKEGNDATKYNIWRYVTENTIPDIDQQKTIQSTGIIFKAAIMAGKDAEDHPELISPDLIAALEAVNQEQEDKTKKPTLDDGSPLPAIYSFHNTLYGGVPDIVSAAKKDGNGGSLWFAVEHIISDWYLAKGDTMFVYMGDNPPTAAQLADHDDDGNEIEPEYVQLSIEIADEILLGTEVTDGSKDYSTGYAIDFENGDLDEEDSLKPFKNSRFIELCPESNITVFIPTNDDQEGWGYYCYYFYWMRHNDNGLSGKMGPMEFATVRNNVYKLAVTNIGSIGHPRDTRRDPDPVDPGDPDEEPERSIQVEVNVLPWVVRVNNIEF